MGADQAIAAGKRKRVTRRRNTRQTTSGKSD